jgi:hypothetical protein
MIGAKVSKGFFLLSLAISALAFVAGCGSSSSDVLTRAEFLKQGNKICAQAKVQQRADVKNFEGDEGGASGLEQVVNTALSPLKDAAGELSSLEAPPPQMKAVKVYVAKLDQGIAKAEAKPTEAITGSPFEDANAAAQQAGLPACAV